jgi:SHAQKYF class myb-like DNA-binding protein
MVLSNKEEGGDANDASNPSASTSTRPKRRRDESENCEEQKASLEEQAATQMDREPSQGPWKEDLHRSFVQAIFEIGLENSSPAVVMKEMTNHSHQNMITGERMKSHLQKFRKNKEKEEQRFLNHYDRLMEKLSEIDARGDGFTSEPPAAVVIKDLIGADKLLGGGLVAATLSHSVMTTNGPSSRRKRPRSGPSRSKLFEQGLVQHARNYAGFPAAKLPPPNLTESEKQMPLGMSLTLITGLLSHMENHLMEQRTSNMQALPGQTATAVAASESSRVCRPESEVHGEEKPLQISPLVFHPTASGQEPAPTMPQSHPEHQYYYDATSCASSSPLSSEEPLNHCYKNQHEQASSSLLRSWARHHVTEPPRSPHPSRQPSSGWGADRPYNIAVPINDEHALASSSRRCFNVDTSVDNSRNEDDPYQGGTPALAEDDSISSTSTPSFAFHVSHHG